uniref:Glutamate-rich 3 n=1 Tax=Neogobius melanostomus TaxID=47308 RepID=A0A8C6WVW3_9GOBI
MNHLNPGLISAYNSLTDKHLAGYFSNTRIRRHLHRAGLITRSGRIVPDKEYRQKLIQRAHQRHVRECLAQAIFHKVLEMERLHHIEIKRKLEEFARRERVHKIKVDRSKRYEEDIIRILSPHPPTGARGIRKQHSGPEGEHTESSESVSSVMVHLTSMDKDPDRRLNTMEVRNGISPYCLPVINNFVTPVPPSTRRKEHPVKLSTSGTVRGRRLRPTTGSSAADVTEHAAELSAQSRVRVNMVYLGKSVHLSSDLPDLRDEVKVFQQHCGGENLCIYKGKLTEGESFQFTSRRHRGFPFSLTFFLNGLQVERLSSCCEFKHRKSSRLGGRHGHFAFTGVEAASPCYKCIIALGLDKKPVPPPKRMKEDAMKMGIVPRLKVSAGPDTETTKAEDPVSRSECESSPRKDTEEERAHEDNYEEDFEADDEGPVEEEKEKKCTDPNGEREEKAKETAASDSEESEKEDGVKSHSGSSFTGSDREESDAEEVKEAKAEDKEEPPEEAQEEIQEEAPRDVAAAAQSTEANNCETQDSTGQSTEIEIGDNSGPSGNENRETSDTHTTSEGERRTDESTQDEPERGEYGTAQGAAEQPSE